MKNKILKTMSAGCVATTMLFCSAAFAQTKTTGNEVTNTPVVKTTPVTKPEQYQPANSKSPTTPVKVSPTGTTPATGSSTSTSTTTAPTAVTNSTTGAPSKAPTVTAKKFTPRKITSTATAPKKSLTAPK